jgi:hypothetical protein
VVCRAAPNMPMALLALLLSGGPAAAQAPPVDPDQATAPQALRCAEQSFRLEVDLVCQTVALHPVEYEVALKLEVP